ncbi:hypothetical protein [Actinomadura hibisca]|uniref:hypothetical protein n=1 Tax=Actinomadura hibisca TaxID=68565 RepID=UPI000836B7AB|nr:hypothetical protein [Actinomadura hibisca]
MSDPKTHDSISGAALIVGFYEGVLPFPAKAFDWSPVLCLPRHLAAPYWWIVSLGVLAAVAVVIWRMEATKGKAE